MLFFYGKTALGTMEPMRKTPATENSSTHGMNTPCGSTANVTMEGLLFSKGGGKEEAGDTNIGVVGHTGGSKKNRAEMAPFIFVGLENGEIIMCGARHRRRRKPRSKRKRRVMWHGRNHRNLKRSRCILHGNLDGRWDER